MSVTSRTRTAKRLIGALAALGLAGSIAVLPGCGGDDGDGAGGGRLDDTAFCALVEREVFAAEADPDVTEAELFELVGNLADRAPTADLADAMSTFASIGAQMEVLEEEGDFDQLFELMDDDSFFEAIETIDVYFTDVCGLED